MPSDDFWNLAGRAGRLGLNLAGHIFLIDYETWNEKPLEKRSLQRIVAGVMKTLSDNADEFLAYINDKGAGSGSGQSFENAFTKMFVDYRQGRFADLKFRLSDLGRQGVFDDVLQCFEKIDGTSVTLETETIVKAPNVNPYRQQELMDYFESKMGRGRFDIIPVHPRSEWSSAVDRLRKAFARLHRYLERRPNNSHIFRVPYP
ncbi:MAG: hypothetical protein U5L06_14650 [Rhodovibrio sp.]|nr:hypothetical protein [Rhodovibrio sp.]